MRMRLVIFHYIPCSMYIQQLFCRGSGRCDGAPLIEQNLVVRYRTVIPCLTLPLCVPLSDEALGANQLLRTEAMLGTRIAY